MPTEASSILSLVQELGFGLASLSFSAYLIIWLLKAWERERSIWLDKDSQSDLRVAALLTDNSKLHQETTAKLAELQASSNNQLMNVVEKLNHTLNQMNISITELKATIETAESIKTR
tara:strand:+ start:1097 stop:1450 length:354 start_codon:yes stop_codon:yes gene_type:complete